VSHLLLFDIDGTLLLRGAEAHKRSLHHALVEVFGVEGTESLFLDTPGRTDGEIARIALERNDIPSDAIDARAGELRTAWCRHHASLIEESLAESVAPGMRELMSSLHPREDVRLSLVTGNLEPIARLKLERAGLGEWFPEGQGGFGSDAEDRTVLPALARERAGDGGKPWPRERTVVIGDTPRDIACARADGVRCVAVATGPFAPEELAEADAVAADGHQLGPVLDELLVS